ncbi:MAG: hypothetical protein ACLQF0_03355 [Dissulfurispiraceae bacterium]
MSEALIREISQQIVREQLLQNWVFYVVLLSLLIIGTVASSFITSYFRKRGESYATKADFAELTAQLRITTEAAEQVKTAIAHSDWTVKEWKTLRRVKLEEFVESVYSIEEWLDKERDIRFFGEQKEQVRCPIQKIQIISRLYFPELEDETLAMISAFYGFQKWILGMQQKVLAATGNPEQLQAVYNVMPQEMNTYLAKLLAITSAIEAKVPALMKEIVGV